MADLKIIKNLSGEIDNIPVINTAMSNAIYQGPPGPPGKDGDPGVYVGRDEPTINSLIWINPFIGNVLKIRNSVNDPWVEVPYIMPDMTIYATKEFVANEILKIDLSDYYTKEQVNNLIKNINIDLSDYYTKEQVDNLIPDTSGLATEKYVDDAIANIDIPESSGTVYVGADEPDDELVWFNPDENNSIDLSNYYTKSEVEAKINEALGVIENGTY